MGTFDDAVAFALRRYREAVERDIFEPSPLVRYMMVHAEFENWRHRVADQRLKRWHPWRWRWLHAKAWTHRRVTRAWRGLDPIREAAARRLAPWLVTDDRGDW